MGGLPDVALASRVLREELSAPRVHEVVLPGHGGRVDRARPSFDPGACVAAVAARIEAAAAQAPDAELVLVGHSTGGSLLLAAAAALPRAPALLVLAGTPPRIDAGYGARWAAHLPGAGPDLDEVAGLVSLVNRLARDRRGLPCPTLVLHGEDDALVPAAEAERWRERGPAVRVVRLPGRGHALLADAADALLGDVLRRAVRDAARGPIAPEELRAWQEQAPEVARALAAWPPSLHHLRDGPAGRALSGERPGGSAGAVPAGAEAAGVPGLDEQAPTEPTILDVSVTTRCDLACVACARRFERIAPRDMAPRDFSLLLALAPHALRVVLVGLGEPLLHPDLEALVHHASTLGRRVSLVTSGMGLTPERSRALLDAGLSSLTVSLDAVSPEGLLRTRRGSDLPRILAHLGAFTAERARRGLAGTVGASVFTALGAETAGELPGILAAVRPLGVDAVMATDLNFPENAARSLHRTPAAAAAAALDGPLRASLAGGLPVLSVHGLEALDLPRRFRPHLLLRGAQLAARAAAHAHCASPWQNLPVDPAGEATLCDCQPGAPAGNLLSTPLSEVWNGSRMRRHRREMREANAPPACLACPRF
jgi:MoaA/NifB/PqqE/SkfB family radical SAM enzyme/pimeloyl-ACP methyl ester carboxylesterase